MLRKNLVAALNEVSSAIASSGVIDALKISRDKTRNELGIGIPALHEFSYLCRGFSPAALDVVKIFGIYPLVDPRTWVDLLTEESPARLKLIRTINTMMTELPKILALLHQDTVESSSNPQHPAKPSEIETVRISLIEEGGQFSTVERVIAALSACQDLYNAVQRMRGDIAVPLGVGAIDSGSDKSFDLFGAAEAMKEFRELVVTIWGLVVFHRENKMGRRLELIAAALPILVQVEALIQEQKIGREEGLIIKNGIIDGTKKFIEAGVLTEDLANHSQHDPRALLAPEPKLLMAPEREFPTDRSERITEGPSGNRIDRSSPSSLEDLRPEDLERLAAMLEARRSRADRPPSPEENDTTNS